jgi:hypothetical protein
MIETTPMIENIDFELVPNGEDYWDVRILRGDFIETVINFGTMKLAEDGKTLKFDFEIVYTPNDDVTEDTFELQEVASKILLSVIDTSMDEDGEDTA